MERATPNPLTNPHLPPPMKRHPALQDLSRDHFTALNHVVQVRRVVEGDRFARPVSEVGGALRSFWESELELHFEEEEATIVPRIGEAPELLARFESDHAALREGFQDIAAMKGEGGDSWDLDRMWEVAQLLGRHARWEEEHLFQWLQDNLDEPALQALWDESQAFRHRTRGPGAVGPPQ